MVLSCLPFVYPSFIPLSHFSLSSLLNSIRYISKVVSLPISFVTHEQRSFDHDKWRTRDLLGARNTPGVLPSTTRGTLFRITSILVFHTHTHTHTKHTHMPAAITGPIENVKRSCIASQLSIKIAFRINLSYIM